MPAASPRPARSRSLPKAARPVAVVPPSPRDWQQWQALLAARPAIKPLPLLASQMDSALLCGASAWVEEPRRRRIADLHRAVMQWKAPRALAAACDAWLAASDGVTSPAEGLEAIAWASVLPLVAQVLAGERWCLALDRLDAAALEPIIAPVDHPLLFQLTSVELPATLARVFPELPSARPLLAAAKKNAALLLLGDSLDADGLLPPDRFTLAFPLWSSWLRCRALEVDAGLSIFDQRAAARLDKYFRHVIRLQRENGSFVFTNPAPDRDGVTLQTATERLAVAPTTAALATAVRARSATGADPKGLPHSAWQSEEFGIAALRTRWTAPVHQATLRYIETDLDVEWQAAGRVIGGGPWTWQATVDGKPLQADGNWEQSCWHSDADVDYLELELPLSGGWSLQRQTLLARNDGFLYLADALIGSGANLPEPAELTFTASWPLLAGAAFERAKDSREGWCTVGKKRVATAIPLALPEWRAEFCHGDLKQTADGRLEWTLTTKGRNLYLPLWLDLDPQRIGQPLTWRRLTVAEELVQQPRDVAVGYRVQSGAQQWMLYRSIAERGNRTVLGQNYSTEFVCSRFQQSGATDELLEIV